jgi:protein-tyrosine phosphatase
MNSGPIDCLLAMVDIHTHVLPGLDDGAPTLEEGFEMVKLAAANGTTDLVATPHSNAHFEFDECRIDELFRGLSALSAGMINLYRGCDCHMNLQNLEDALAHPTKYTINRTRYLLVELPDFMGPSVVWHQLQALINARICPIITHPERNISLQSNMDHLKRWVEGGCLVQVTGQSFSGRFGAVARRAVEKLMDADLVHFVASDAHDCVDRPPDLSKAHEHVSSRWGRGTAQRLFIDNPAAVIADAPIDRGRQLKRRFSVFSFGSK